MQIDTTYIRRSPLGDTTLVTPTNQKQVEYFRSLEAEGFTFRKQPVIHNVLVECESCSA